MTSRLRENAAAHQTGESLGAPLDELSTLIHSGRFDRAEQVALTILREEPRSSLAWKALGVALRMQGKSALHALKRAAELAHGDPEAPNNLGNELFDQGLLDEAIVQYRRAIELAPRFAEALHNLGRALTRRGRFAEAAASFEHALALRPQNAETWCSLGDAQRGLGLIEGAAASYRRAIEIDSTYAEAHNNLGTAFLGLHRLPEAVACYRRACGIRAEFAEAHCNLGNALREAGELAAAVESYRRALALRPGLAGAHSNLGDVLLDLGDAEAAHESCRRSLELDAAVAESHNSLGNALLALGRVDEAIAAYRNAVRLDPRFTKAHINLGLAQRQADRGAEAEASCRAALDLDARSAAALVLLAELQTDQGRFAAARDLYERAAAADPACVEACAGLVHLRKMGPHDGQWLRQARRLADRRLPPRQEIYLRYALGKYFDDVGGFDAAFENFQRANALAKAQGPGYDAAGWTAAIDSIIQHDVDPRSGETADDPELPGRPVFIVGMPRSGTSLAEQILASHEAVHGAGELPFWNDAARNDAAGHRDTQASGALGAEYRRLLAGKAPGALRVIDKMPSNFLRLGLIHRALPDARVIHLRRNALDTCLSIYFQHFKSGHTYANDLDDLCHYYLEYQRVMSHWQAALPPGTLLEVRYEALVEDLETVSRDMIAFIGLPWDPRCLEFHRTERRVRTASKWQVRQKISRNSVGRWRNYEKYLGPLQRLAQR